MVKLGQHTKQTPSFNRSKGLIKFAFILIIACCPFKKGYSQCCNGFFTFGDKAATVYPFSQVFDKTFYPVINIGLEYLYTKKKEELPTGTCLILVTPDSERTMCTFLGTAGKINENDVSSEAIKKSEIILLEGYLWDEGDPKKAFEKAIHNANKVAMSLSDQFCVDRHKPHFLDLVKNKLDITFANEQEIMSLIDAKNFDDVITFSKSLDKIIVVTRGEKGAVAVSGDEIIECGVKEGLKIVDLTGAGDLFAGGFLHGHVNNMSLKDSLEKGTEMSSKVIQQIGARL